MSDSNEPRKSAADLLKEALAAKKAGNANRKQKLRPDMGNAKASKDAERLAGKSRKVH
jgi:hypothetical protein